MDKHNLNEKVEIIKNWLDTGSLNIFGLPMSGKDTVGMRLADNLQAKFLSSGIIIRAYESEQNKDMTGSGRLIPTNTFYDIILPYFSREELRNDALVLSSVGRWSGEEDKIMEAAKAGGHEIKAVILLDLTEEEVKNRFEVAKTLNDRGERADDSNIEVFETRLAEFREKTMPVLNHYDELKMLVKVPAIGSRDEVYANVVDRLVEFIDSL